MVDLPPDIHPINKHCDDVANTTVANTTPTANATVSTSTTVTTNIDTSTPQSGFSVRSAFDQSAQQKEQWFKIWHIAIAYCYILICISDFVGFPLLMMFLPVVYHAFGIAAIYVPWVSLTLANGGMLHAAFGAILGVSAWTRFSDSKGNY